MLIQDEFHTRLYLQCSLELMAIATNSVQAQFLAVRQDEIGLAPSLKECLCVALLFTFTLFDSLTRLLAVAILLFTSFPCFTLDSFLDSL